MSAVWLYDVQYDPIQGQGQGQGQGHGGLKVQKWLILNCVIKLLTVNYDTPRFKF